MAQVKVTQDITVRASDVANVHYTAGWEGKAPKAHVQAIVEAGAGKELGDAGAPDPAGEQGEGDGA